MASVVTPASEDGSVVLSSSAAAYYAQTVDMDTAIKSENDLIRRYREISLSAECDAAIEEITNEAICFDETGSVAELETEELKVSDSIKKKMHDEFEEILALLKFNENAHDLFRKWYIDGRQYHVITLDPARAKDGILKVELIDSRKIRKVKKVDKKKDPKSGVDLVVKVEEYFIYNEKGIDASSTSGVKLSLDSVIYVPSGLYDQNTNMMFSYLHKAVKPTNQLKMLEDAVVINTLARAPERRIFYIDVGNLPKLKAEQYVTDIMNKYRNKVVYDATTGEVRDDRKHQCLVMDTRVPLLDGRTLTIAEIASEYQDKQLWAYSCDPITGAFVPGLITWAGVARPNAQIVRITLDNGKTIDCTPDHRFPVWGKGLVAAEELTIGESMIPLYRRKENITPNSKNKEYEQIFDNDKKEWTFTHRTVSKWKDSVGLDNQFVFNEDFNNGVFGTVHHKNINRMDNSPENLVRMNSKDHWSYHHHSSSGAGKVGGLRCYEMGLGVHNKNHPDYTLWHINGGKAAGAISAANGNSSANLALGRMALADLMKTKEFNGWFRSQQRAGWKEEQRAAASNRASKNGLSDRGNDAKRKLYETKEHRDRHTKMYATEYSYKMFEVVQSCARKGMRTAEVVLELNNSAALLEEWKELNINKCSAKKQKSFDAFNYHDVGRIIKNHSTVNSYSKLKEQAKFRNHKIVSIEYLEERVDTGCLTIDGGGLYHDHHTFALEAGIYTENSMLEDFWLPRREGGKGTEITTLPGSGQLIDNDLITYFQQKLYQSLNVPVSRLQPSQGFSLGRSSEITRDELKFNKFVSRLRNKFSQILLDLLRVQLIAKNIIKEDEWFDLEKFISVKFKNDNNFVELKENELWQGRISMLQQVDGYVGKWVSPAWVQKNILKLSAEDVKTMEQELDKMPKRFLPPELPEQ